MNKSRSTDDDSRPVQISNFDELANVMKYALTGASGYARFILRRLAGGVAILTRTTPAYLTARRAGRRYPLSMVISRTQDGDLSTLVPRRPDADVEQLAQRSEAALVAVENRLDGAAQLGARQSAMLLALQGLTIVTDAHGQIQEQGPEVGLLLGETTTLTGRQLRELLPFIPPREHGSSAPGPWTGPVVKPAGDTVYIEVRHSQLPERLGPVSDLYVLHDITRYVELAWAREDLLHNAAHELRSLMTSVQVNLDFLLTEGQTLSIAEFQYYLGAASKSTMRYRDLLENLLSAASIQTGRFQVRTEPTDLRGIIEDALDSVSPSIEQRRQRVDCQLPDAPQYVMADPRYARLVIVNVLSNASKYSPNDTVIRVWTENTDGQVRVSVADRGPGIPPEQQVNIFDRYYRAAPKHESPGVGLGLAIAKGIMDAHVGSIGVESEVGIGTNVWVAFLEAGAESYEDFVGGRRF